MSQKYNITSNFNTNNLKSSFYNLKIVKLTSKRNLKIQDNLKV